MSSYMDMFRERVAREKPTSIGGVFNAIYNTAYDRSHGAARYYLSQLPIFGWGRRFTDEAQRIQDYYDNTGEDPKYMSRMGAGAGASPAGMAGALGVARMARSLSSLYPAEVKESVRFHRYSMPNTLSVRLTGKP